MFRRLHFVRHIWFLLFSVGLALFIGVDIAFNVMHNIGLLPVVVVLGATLVPLTFVVYVYQRVQVKDTPISTIAVVTFLGGGLGLVAAGVLEYATLQTLGYLGFLEVGLIEESAKLIVPLIVYFRGRHRSQATGLLIGVASGMGFSALETVAYGMASFIGSGGDVGTAEQTLLVRGLLSPLGHGAWTGLVCSVLWREREKAGHNTLTLPVIISFAAAVLLHAAWNTAATLTELSPVTPVVVEFAGLAAAGLVSLALLIWRMRTAGLRHPSHFTGGSGDS